MSLNISQFESRLPQTASDNSRHSVRAAIMIANGFREKAAAIRADGRLSAEGQTAELAKLKAATSTNGHLVQIRTQAQKQLDTVRAERQTFRAAVLKKNADHILELRHSEIRSFLRSMSESERIKLATSGDPEIVDAVILASPVLSGLPGVLHGRIIEGVVESRFGSRADD
jgi:hypothetical protein